MRAVRQRREEPAHELVLSARARLDALGFTVTMAPGQHSLKVPDGDVLKVRPAEGTSLKKGATVTIVPSLGPPPVPVPSVVGQTLAHARSLLVRANLEPGRPTQAYSDTVKAGIVISQDPPSGTAPQGSPVSLVVSQGPPPVNLPNVVRTSQESATKILNAKGFHVIVTPAFSKTVQSGFVISQDPSTPQAPKGSTVTIVVSQGPPTFPIASYLGMTKDAAIAAITADGLRPNVSYVPGGVTGHVVGQNPAVGTTVHAGDTVTIFVA